VSEVSLPLTELGVAVRTLAGQRECGDLYLFRPFARGLLVAAIDGLGHGEEAAAAAKTAVDTLSHQPQAPVGELFERCHQSLKKTRGAVMSLASFSGIGHMTWAGVGNVEGRLLRADAGKQGRNESLMLLGGVVGYAMPSPRVSTVELSPGDTLIFATDGIRDRFTEGVDLNESSQTMAETILSRHGKATDDALDVVVRYLGSKQ
jgi:negative regulator of sigma-B (phosphoserine phosphatase)